MYEISKSSAQRDVSGRAVIYPPFLCKQMRQIPLSARGLVADELKANGNPPAEYVFSEPSSFKVIVRSADPHVHSSETHVGTQDGTHMKSIREERQDKLIQLVHMHPEFTMEEMAGEMGISRTSVYRLIKSMNGKVKYNGDQYHGEWIVIEGEGE